jgi:CubicO group peptidase (beta-lactamase class C family)
MKSNWLADFRAVAEEESAAGRFSGAVLIGRGQERIFAEAYGFADREQGIPNRLSTRFRHGSISKMFTGVAVGQLIQGGQVDPAAPVGTYLSDYPNRDVATKVSIHHLLTHTGGTGDMFSPEYFERREQVRTIADYLALYDRRGPRFEPGTRYEYSNYGFILLGAVIEKVSRQDYDDYLDQHVFAPAGMIRTGALPEESAVPDLAVGYTTYTHEHGYNAEDGHERPNTDTLLYRGTPAGGGYTTVEDLWRFATALIGNRLLDAHHTALVTTAQGNAGWEGRHAAYGFFQNMVFGRIFTYGHKGGAPGMSGDLGIWPESGHVVAILANMDPPIADEVAGFIYCRLPVERA